MSNSNCYKSILAFRFLCWMTTSFLLGYWIYLYSLDEDICLVDYKKYYELPEYTFPVLSLCIKNPFSMLNLTKQATDVDNETYAKFLKGEFFSHELMKLDYHEIVHNFSNYVTEYWIKWRNGRSETFSNNDTTQFFIPSYSGFFSNVFYSCNSLQIPHQENISAFFVLLENSVYPSGQRYGNYDTLVFIHAANQLLISGESMMTDFPERKKNYTYSMNFLIRGVEKIRRRNKKIHPCNENWMNHDFDILKDHAKFAGCTPPYHRSIDSIPSCSTQDQIQRSLFTLRLDNYGKYPPCQGIERVDYHYQEPSMKNTVWSGFGKFWIGLYLNNQKFKEVEQTQKIDLNGLIGYIGGYIGLILGYSILQIPDLIIIMKFNLRYFLTSKLIK